MAKKDILKGRSVVRKNIVDTVSRSIDEIKRANPLLEYFESKGVTLTKSGDEYKGLCPFHNDKTPSLSVNGVKEVFKCSGCGKKGTVIDAVCYFENVGTGEAIKMLGKKERAFNETALKFIVSPAAWASNEAKRNDQADELKKAGSVEKPPPADKVKVSAGDESPEAVDLNRIIEYYHKKLYENEKALEILQSRGITNGELYSRFKIGFAPQKQASGGQADGSLLDKVGEGQKKALQELGIINNYGDETFSDCHIFPVFNESDQAVGIYGRSINAEAKVKHLYLKGNHKGIFNAKAVKVYDEIILTESIIDALSLIQAGVQNVTACYGVNGFTPVHLETLKENNVKSVVIAFDNDNAGLKAGEELKEKLVNENFKVKMICPPSKKDWNEELIRGIDADSIKSLVDCAEIFAGKDKRGFEIKKDGFGYTFTIGDVVYSMSNVKMSFSHNLKVNISTFYGDERFPDTVDLYSSRSRDTLAMKLSQRFGLEVKKIERDLLAMLDYLEDEQKKQLEPEDAKDELTEGEKELGLRFLKSKNIFNQIIDDVTTLGYVGEDLNKLMMYLCAASRKTSYPVSVLIIAQSSTGKSYLVDIVKKLIPKDEVITIHSVSDQGLNYTKDLLNKFIAFGEAIFTPDVERQIREMLSSKELTRLVVNKDDTTGELISKLISKEVLVACVMSSTSNNVHPENASRFFIINADESFDQTKNIHVKQMEKYSEDRYYEKQESIPGIIAKHHAAQKLLQDVHIIIPHVMRKMIKFPFHSLRTRRDHERFIDLMGCVCFLRQYQKKKKQFKDGREYVECDHIDYETAKRVMINGTLASTLSEIPESAVRLYEAIRKMVAEIAETEGLKSEEVTFSQRDVREFTGFGQSWIKQNLRSLVEFEYIHRVRGGKVKGSRGFYRLKADEEMIKLDFSMLPDAEEVKKVLAKQAKVDNAHFENQKARKDEKMREKMGIKKQVK